MLVDYFSEREGEFDVEHPERYHPTEFVRRCAVVQPVVHSEITEEFRVMEAVSKNPSAELRAAILDMDDMVPVVVKRRYDDADAEVVAVKAAADLGVLLLDGLAEGVWVDAPALSDDEVREIELMILQAARVRFSHTDALRYRKDLGGY